MTYQAILVASAILLCAFGIERLSRALGLPSVVALIATGFVAKPALAAFDLTIEGLDVAVPVIGTVGLVLIVLEGALDIELRRDRLRAGLRALFMAAAGIVACGLAIAALIAVALPVTPFQAALLAVPLAVISSAVAIPSSDFLPAAEREFVVYESAISDILGVLLFFSLLSSDGTVAGVFVNLLDEGLLSLLLGLIVAVGLTLVLPRIGGHIRFVPLLAAMFGLYAVGKLLHLSPLIMVLLFGLALNNPGLITRLRPFRRWHDEGDGQTLRDFKVFTAELTFAVRGFFFILLGYWTDLAALAVPQAWIGAAALLVLIYASRAGLLRLAGAQPREVLTWIAPRGLITVLLYLAAKDVVVVPPYLDGLVLLVVLISASASIVARRRWDARCS